MGVSTDAGPRIRCSYSQLSSVPVDKVGGQAWVFLTKSDDERSWSANTGYDDSVGRYYSYDSNVSRYRQVRPGDLAVIRVDDYVVGWSFIDDIEVIPNVPKEISRCPRCLATNFRQRKTLLPRNICNACGAGFSAASQSVCSRDFAVFGAAFFRAAIVQAWLTGNCFVDIHRAKQCGPRRSSEADATGCFLQREVLASLPTMAEAYESLSCSSRAKWILRFMS